MRGEEGGICSAAGPRQARKKNQVGRVVDALFGLLQHGVEKSTLDVFFSCFAYCKASVWWWKKRRWLKRMVVGRYTTAVCFFDAPPLDDLFS